MATKTANKSTIHIPNSVAGQMNSLHGGNDITSITTVNNSAVYGPVTQTSLSQQQIDEALNPYFKNPPKIKSIETTEETDKVILSSSTDRASYSLDLCVKGTRLELDIMDDRKLEAQLSKTIMRGSESLIPFFVEKLGLDVNNLPFELVGNSSTYATLYATFWDTDTKKIVKQAVEMKNYTIKDFELDDGFFTTYRMLHHIQQKEFLQDIWDMIVQAKFKYIFNINERIMSSGRKQICVRGVLQCDYDEAAGCRKQDILNKIVEKYGINKDEMPKKEDLIAEMDGEKE